MIGPDAGTGQPGVFRDLSTFDGSRIDRGRPVAVRCLWLAVSGTVLMRWWLPNRARIAVLRAFGAVIGKGCIVRHRVRIELPWFLEIGDHTWIGEGVWIIDKAPVRIGSHVCVSQGAVLCAASHDPRRSDFPEIDRPVTIGDGAWVALGATVLSGVTVGTNAVVRAGEVAARDIPSVRPVTAHRKGEDDDR
ncbi:putative colanic acid biosynthesis acetyltransferase [Tsukamurella asaccharolytica]|uniref:putative colanic acid biosynthesis acetyltransferase n=1 Tax=Tsukamurella asaccharolytica TaxID=2592067 RepID=UPI0019616936|nr:putative colanic acid biosynthesis acetyltransferase [Tsukamurella asaccharolytica]